MTTADQDQLVFRYARPEILAERSDIILSRTDVAMMSVSLLTSPQSSELHVHTSMDLFWLVVGGRITIWNERDEVIGDAGPGQGVVVPRGHALRYLATPAPDHGVFECYRFIAADVGSTEFVDDKIWLSGPLAGPGGVADLDPVAPSPHRPIDFDYRSPRLSSDGSEQVLASTDRGVLAVRLLSSGAAVRRPADDHLEAFFFVRRGAARFYSGTSGSSEVLAELQAGGGVLVPRQHPCWFEATTPPGEDCEILQLLASDVPITDNSAATAG